MTHADILAAFAKMDTLAAADLISDLFRQALANATADEATALCEVWLGTDSVHSAEDALAEAVCNLRDHRDAEPISRAHEAAELRYKLDRELAA